jgi:thiosulfate/3-mercaptopyruvate sulfurtransferase
LGCELDQRRRQSDVELMARRRTVSGSLHFRLVIQQARNGGFVMKRLMLISLSFLWAQAAVAASSTIVDGNYVAEAIARNAVVWDVRAADAYAKGHIAGAVSIGDAARVLRDENTEDFIATNRIEKILGAAGLDPNREIIVYGSRGTWNPYFGLYTLRYFGGSNVRVYHEGIEDWAAAGRPISRDASQLPPVALKLEINPTVAVTTKEMVARLNNPNLQILDVRTPQEFIGEDIRAIRGGHIPGAINIPYEQNWVDPETLAKLARKQITSNAGMSLKSAADLKRLYSRLDPSKETIVYCQSGARASQTAGVLRQLGFTNVKVYDSSWLGYGNTLDAPADNVTFFNVGLLNSRLSALQERVNQLEKELAEARATPRR